MDNQAFFFLTQHIFLIQDGFYSQR